jgi:hypothetical protein
LTLVQEVQNELELQVAQAGLQGKHLKKAISPYSLELHEVEH